MNALLTLLLVVLSFGSGHAVGQEPGTPACESCKDRGVVGCRVCASKPCNSERGFTFCSVAQECGECGGVRWLDCPACARPADAELERKRAELAAWRAGKREVEDVVAKRDLVFIDSQRFRLVSDLKKLEIKGAGNAHALAHLYLDRLERLHAEFVADSGVPEDKFTGPTTLMLWTSEKDQERASSKYTLEKATPLAKLMGKNPVVSICFGKGQLKDDEGLHRAVVHQVAHCLLSNAYDGVWLGNLKSGWIDEGVAHVYEQRYFGSVEIWCATTDKLVADAKLGRFEAHVLQALGQNSVVGLTTLSGQDTVALSPLQRVFGWSYCDFLLRHRKGSLGPLARILKQSKPLSEAVQSALQIGLVDLELEWSTWVKANYSAKRK
ncbi:MAG: hypothetical protein IT454_06960 [Planctomycetes bacterium]|nr:hypothetical protein [Planctomycetota bacterium]